MGLIPILLIVALILLLFRGRGRVPPSAAGVSARDPVRFIVLVLALIVLAINLFAPLGNYRL